MHIPSIAAIALTSIVLSAPAISQEKAGAHSGMHGSQSSPGKMSHGSMQSSPDASKAEFEHQFLDTMAAHHQSAIEMAQLVEKRSSHDELKQMAKKIIDDQQDEIKQMTEWKNQWYPDKGDAINMKMPGMAESMKGMSVEKLEASTGDPFDAMFLDMMTRHHQGAVKMAQSALTKAKHPEVKKTAQKVIDEQKKEIAQMSKWKKEWRLATK
ncbi:DUF305 domain-containing protein [Herbaspirillum sp. GCM10030257]|uniref:DUF305 domain-containing protein n=1 Tax=Herbaspirillum sp. GCM10030257 TaxID=3273393 RepID=UPI00361B6A9F